MNPKVKKIITQVAAQKNHEVSPAAFKELHKYDLKWKPRFKRTWNTDLIQVVLADSAIKMARRDGRMKVNINHVRKSIEDYCRLYGQYDECLGAGLTIMKEVQNKGVGVVYPEFGSFVKKNLAG